MSRECLSRNYGVVGGPVVVVVVDGVVEVEVEVEDVVDEVGGVVVVDDVVVEVVVEEVVVVVALMTDSPNRRICDSVKDARNLYADTER